jgi:hypothetical protein
MDNEHPTTMEDVVADLKRTVEEIGKGLDHDEDWIPVLSLYGKKPAIVGIPFLGDPEVKDLIANKLIPGLIKQAKPDFAALVTLGWMKRYETTTIEGAAEQARDEARFAPGNIADRPGKSECLVIQICAKDGAEHQLMAYVHRYPSGAPTLEWFHDSAVDMPKDQSGGRFPDALRAGMEAAWKTKK